MKKLFIFAVFSVIIILSAGTVFASEDIQSLCDIGIFKNDVYENKKVTVEELSRITSKLISEEEIPSLDTENPLMGYVNLMKESGVISAETDVKKAADGETVSKMYLFALGYLQAAETANSSYTAFAQNIGILKGSGISGSTEVTYGMLARATMNTVTEKLALVTVSSDGGINVDKSDASETILSRVYNISVYKAVINSIDEGSGSVKAEITDNVYSSNKVYIPDNTNIVFRLSDKVNAQLLDNTPSIIWVRDKTIVSARLQGGVNVRFEVISSINGNENLSGSYSAANINKIMFYDDKKEYKTGEKFKIRYNGEILGEYEPVRAVGKYARTVLQNNEIVFLEVWDFENNGLILSTEDNIINFINGTNNTAKIKNLDRYSFVKIIINGNYSNISSLKKGSVFSWAEYKGGIVIAVNEQVVSAEFKAMASDSLRIGDIYYKKSDKVYASKDGIKFSDNNDILLSCVGNDVSAYFNVKKEICYIAPVKGNLFTSSSFTGTATGIKKGTMDESAQIEILCLEGNCEKKIYTLDDKVQFEDGITLVSLTEAVLADDGSAIYEFEVNKKGEISRIKNVCGFKGFPSSVITFSRFDTDTAYASVSNSGVQYYLGSTPFIAVYRDYNGEWQASRNSWSSLYGKNASGVNFHLIGYEDSSDVKMIIMTGKTQNISYYETRYGVLKDKWIETNEYGDKCCKIVVLSNQSESEYTLPYEEGISLPQRAYVTYQIGFNFDSSRTIKIISASDLTGEFDEWQLEAFKEDTVAVKGERSFITTSGALNSMHPYYCYVAVLEDGEIVKGDMTDVEAGDKIYYYTEAQTARIIFVAK